MTSNPDEQIAPAWRRSANDPNPYLESSPYAADGGYKIGRDPRTLEPELLADLEPKSPIRAIREYCIGCSGGNAAEVRKCVSVGCPSWAFRMGVNPHHARSGAQRDKGQAEDSA